MIGHNIEVGVMRRLNFGCLASRACTAGCLCGVVDGDQVQRLPRGRLAVAGQELQPLGMRVALLAFVDDWTVQRVERREQRWGAEDTCTFRGCTKSFTPWICILLHYLLARFLLKSFMGKVCLARFTDQSSY